MGRWICYGIVRMRRMMSIFSGWLVILIQGMCQLILLLELEQLCVGIDGTRLNVEELNVQR